MTSKLTETLRALATNAAASSPARTYASPQTLPNRIASISDRTIASSILPSRRNSSSRDSVSLSLIRFTMSRNRTLNLGSILAINRSIRLAGSVKDLTFRTIVTGIRTWLPRDPA